MKLKSIALLALCAAAFMSCSTSKTTLPYFTDLPKVEQGVLEQISHNTVIAIDDELMITINSSDPEATAHYNLPFGKPVTKSSIMLSSNPQQQTYIVDSKGNINLPTIGEIHVVGLTVEELQKQLTEIVHKDVSDAIVRVEIVNFTVQVAGEVTKPATINVTRNRFSILDALTAAGDLTPYGERSDILIIREENGQRTYAHLDLNSSEILTSPYFYVRQNDYIYVAPNKIRQDNSRYNQDNAFKLSVISTIVSASSVIVSLIIALSAK